MQLRSCSIVIWLVSTCVLNAQQKLPVQKLQDPPDRAAEVDRLIGQMTLEEKVSQLQNGAAAIPRLNIPAYNWWNEGLHGVARSGYATLFPQAIGMAATWDPKLLHRVGETISTEARAKYNQAIREGNHDIYFGLTIWSPNINIFRDPRWGRGQETYGEDPYLTGRLGVAFASGLQGDDPAYLRAVATPKHFAVHSGPESSRHKFNVEPSPHDLEDTYLPAFRATITEARAQSLMCAYNAVDGAPACANPALLQTRLRDAWHFDGFITSDCGAVTDVADGHKFSADVEHASVASLRAGTDTSCGEEYATLTKAVKDGLVKESELDVALHRLFLARYRLGMSLGTTDPPTAMPYASVPFTEVDSAAHRKLSLETARESMVLLKNDGTLPLKKMKTVAVIGPNAASLAAIEGNYNAIPSHPVFPIEGIRQALAGKADVIYAQGSPYVAGISLPAPETLFHPAAGAKENGLHAEYFAGSGFTGRPVTVRTDPTIQFDWNGGSPLPDVADSTLGKNFSVRWSGTISAPAPGDIPFSMVLGECYPCNAADGYTVYLDDKRVAGIATTDGKNAGRDAASPPFTLHFEDTQPHSFRVEYSHASPRFGGGIYLNWQPPVEALRAQAVQAAAESDVVVAFVGLSPQLEGEEMPVHVEGFTGGDRTDIELPKVQQQMLDAVAATGKPVVVVLLNGSALAVRWAQQHAVAILEAWYPGEQGGTAIAESLLGTNNPGGRLPVTFYKSVAQLPAFDDYAMKSRTYRYLREQPLYEFGYGLSYTSFAYSGTSVSSTAVDAASLSDSAPLLLKTTVRNTGKIDGDEVAEVYLTSPASDLAPRHALIAFERVHLRAGESRTLSFALSPRQLSQVDAGGMRGVVAGAYTLHVSGSQPAAADLGVAFTVTGTQALPE